MQWTDELQQRAVAVRVLILDVDGVLTDGRLYYNEQGEALKTFNIRDGHGIKMLQNQGIKVAVISGRRSAALQRRLQDLGVQLAWLGVEDKDQAFAELLTHLSITRTQVAYLGDDLIDLPVMTQVGLAIAVADADAFVVQHAHWRTVCPGGQGAVREVCERLLAAHGLLEAERARYLRVPS